MASQGAAGPSLDPSNRNYNLTAIQMQRDLAEAQAEAISEALGETMREVMIEANEPIIDHLGAIRESTARTAETLQDAITMSE
jgi:hypothetical protein